MENRKSPGPQMQPKDELYEELSAELERAETLVARVVLQNGVRLRPEQMEALSTLNRQIRGSLYSDLVDRSDVLLLLTQDQMRIRLDPQEMKFACQGIADESLEEASVRRRSASREKALRSSFTVSAASFALAFTFWGLGELQDRRYFESTTIEEANRHRRLFRALSTGSMISAGIGVVGTGVSATLYLSIR